MKGIIFALGAVAVIVLALMLRPLYDDVYRERAEDRAYHQSQLERIERERAMLELERAEAEQQAALAWTEARQGVYTSAETLLVLGLAVAALGAVAGAFVLAQRRARLVYPDRAGNLPVPYADLVAGRLNDVAVELANMRRAVELATAQRPAVPTHYSPSISYAPSNALELEYRNQQSGMLPEPARALMMPTAAAPAFASLIGDVVRPGSDRIVFGADAESGELITGSWLDLYSVGVGGLSGSGKSWTATALLCQSALLGARIAILDPHGGNPESLTARLAPLENTGVFLCRPARSLTEQDAVIGLVREELRRRSEADRPGEPWIVAIDEYAALQRSGIAGELAELLEALGQEGRKLGLYALACSQVWTAARSGGTETRDALASAFIHRLRPAQARYLTGLTADSLPGDLLELPAGTCYMLSNAGELRKIVIPRMTPADVAAVAAQLGGAGVQNYTPGEVSPPETRRPFGFQTSAPRNPDETHLKPTAETRETSSGRGAEPSPDEARILALFRAGKTVGEIVKAIHGDVSGPKYNRLRDEVEAIIRQALGGQGAA